MALAYPGGGVLGLMLLKFCLLSLSLGLLARALRELPVLVRSGCLLLATWSAVAPIGLTVRPHLWSWLFTILVARLAVAAIASASDRLSADLRCLDQPSRRRGRRRRARGRVGGMARLDNAESRWLALVTALAGGAATLVNPYGVRKWQFWRRRYGSDATSRNGGPLGVQARRMGPSVGCGRVAGGCGRVVQGAARADRLAVMLVFAYASARTMRLVPFFVVISIIYAIPSLRALTSGGWSAWRLEAPSPGVAAVSLIPVLLVAPIHREVWRSNSRCMTIQGEWAPDRAVGAALQASSPHGRLVTTFGWGEFSSGTSARPSACPLMVGSKRSIPTRPTNVKWR